MASIPIFCDAHLHPAQLSSWQPFRDSPICASCHSESDINICMNLRHMYPGYILIGFGIHPQNPDLSLLPYLELLTESHAINCIGEAGFDFFTPEYCKKEQAQSLVWRAQLALAIKNLEMRKVGFPNNILLKLFLRKKKKTLMALGTLIKALRPLLARFILT